MKKILVTGAAGLIGSNFIKYITSNQLVRVLGVDNMTGGNFVIQNEFAEFVKCDVESPRFIELFKSFKPDIVYHMAAYAAEGLSPFIRKFNYTNNLVATANVVNCCIEYGVERLVFLSSMAVYGNKYEPPFHEDLIPAPIDPYGIAKYACEMDIRVAGEQHDLNWCIIRPHNVYGPNQNIWDRYRNVLGIWMKAHLDGKPLNVFGDGQQKRAFSYVGDCMIPLWFAGTSYRAANQIINLGGMKSISISEAADTVIEVMGGGEKVFLEGRHEVKNAYSTWDKSISILAYAFDWNAPMISTRNFDFRPPVETPLKEGLQKMWEYAKTASPHGISRSWDQYEVNKKIYSFWK